MKRLFSFVVLVFTILSLFACSIPEKFPTDGTWYCEELSISIDFSLMNKTSSCAKRYSEDGSYSLCKCMIDYGDGVWICSENQETDYLIGRFRYKDDVFTVTSRYDNIAYSFKRMTNGIE